ncbi:MAG: glyoxalase [Flavobacterium sp.]|uniref:VOC family protein n=1 Tax=Flavobacterium sp. TaxID=239 RepID=UPI001220433D|nr:VOC family protein [Flavobacterium sp.]RZJ65808.1 MAG: glyoxalase [Flavobacterium sp.]
MKPKMIWANLAIKDIDRTTKFYTDLGFEFQGKQTAGGLTSFYFGKDNFVINFFLNDKFENNNHIKAVDASKENEILFSLSADSKEEVDGYYQEVKRVGATIYAEPEVFEKGYTFGFADPDGHKFNVLYWPGM